MTWSREPIVLLEVPQEKGVKFGVVFGGFWRAEQQDVLGVRDSLVDVEISDNACCDGSL